MAPKFYRIISLRQKEISGECYSMSKDAIHSFIHLPSMSKHSGRDWAELESNSHMSVSCGWYINPRFMSIHITNRYERLQTIANPPNLKKRRIETNNCEHSLF